MIERKLRFRTLQQPCHGHPAHKHLQICAAWSDAIFFPTLPKVHRNQNYQGWICAIQKRTVAGMSLPISDKIAILGFWEPVGMYTEGVPRKRKRLLESVPKVWLYHFWKSAFCDSWASRVTHIHTSQPKAEKLKILHHGIRSWKDKVLTLCKDFLSSS